MQNNYNAYRPQQRVPVARGPPPQRHAPVLQLRPQKTPDIRFTFGNMVAVSPQDFPGQPQEFYVILNEQYVLTAGIWDTMGPGNIGVSEDHRIWAGITLTDLINTRVYDPFADGNKQIYLSSLELDVHFRSRKTTEEAMDQEELEKMVQKAFANQLLSPGQRILMDRKGIALLLIVTSIRVGSLGMEEDEKAETLTIPTARGILVGTTQVTFVKGKGSTVNLKASMHQTSVQTRLIDPDFNFESLGIGGLNKEFSAIFRRAFSLRILPVGVRQRLGIAPVKGLLLYGPPGTGKTLIARKIGQMLNSKEPKIVNGPEVLNKFVGQSEENIRKLFADAEAEYKEKGDESQLHLIIFDELDAVCKQRGSSSSSGTGVGDNIVNQLLAKLDGVNEMNNVLLIGMTNRKDLIDEALLRPGRLEVHMMIPLPDEEGRAQILGIHTAELRKNNALAPDVDLKKVAAISHNYSGAELAGVVRAATSLVAARNADPKNMANMSRFSLDKFVVTQQDLEMAVGEVTPGFGVADKDFESLKNKGIIRYSQNVERILDYANTVIKQVRAGGQSSLYTMVLHGASGAGKSALAAEIAMNSGFPFVKLLSSNQMVGMHEAAKLQHITKVMSDATNSPLSLVVIDDIEQIFDWIEEGPRFENATRKALWVSLTKRPPEGKRLLIIATTSQKHVLDRLNMWPSFRTKIHVPLVTQYQELAAILQGEGQLKDVEGAIRELQAMSGSDRINVGIKHILYDIDAACQHPGAESQVFAQQILSESSPAPDGVLG